MQVLRSVQRLCVCVVLMTILPGVFAQSLTKVERPSDIKKLMAERGQQEQALPSIKIISPKENEVIQGHTAPLKLLLSGDLKGYQIGKDPVTGTGNHIQVMLDDHAYETYYELGAPLTLTNLTPGQHTLRVVASRPWHESYKNKGALAMVTFTVNNLMPMASQRLKVNANKPLLTYSRPQGEYRGTSSDPILIDFWLSNAKLKSEGGKYLVRMTIDGEHQWIERWEPIWLSGWTAGKHVIQLELIDGKGRVVKNGGYNSITREITIFK